MDPQTLSHLATGASGAAFAYALVAIPFLIALATTRPRIPLPKLLASPLLAIPVTISVAVLWSLLRQTILQHATHVDITTLTTTGLIFYPLAGFLAGLAVTRAGLTPPHHIERGTVVLDEQPRLLRIPLPAFITTRIPKRLTPTRPLTMAGFPIALSDETKHFKLIGTTGTGKSTAIRELIGAALARGDRVLFADPDGGYLERFHDAKRGDRILNPFNPDAARWDLFGELQDPYDIDQLARALIPDGGGSDREWRTYARVFFSAILRQMHDCGRHDVEELYRLVAIAPREELKTLVQGTPAQPYLEDANARMFGSIRSVATTYLAALEYVGEQKTGQPLSIRQWIRAGTEEGRGGALFLPYEATQIAALRGLISAWMRLAIFEMMLQPTEAAQSSRKKQSAVRAFVERAYGALTERRTSNAEGEPPRDSRPRASGVPLVPGVQRCWFVVDELDALGAIDGLKDALARLRKFGGRCVLGFQSIAQVSGTYGDAEAQTIVENCGNTLILRCSASEDGGTARFASRLIGERQVLRTQISMSRRGGFLSEPSRTRSWSEQRSTEAAILPSEVEQLPDLTGYLKLASRAEWHRVRLRAGR